MASYRYWGLRVYARTAESQIRCTLAEVDFRATIGGADLCTGGTPGSASSDAPTTPALLFDNDPATAWRRSATATVLVWYDFGVSTTVAQAWFKLPDAAAVWPGSTSGPEGVQVVGSNDGTLWFPLVSYALTSIADGAEYTVEVPASYDFRIAGRALVLDAGVTSDTGGGRVIGDSRSYDAADEGAFRVAGTVKIDGTPATPVARRVRLFDVISGRLIRQTWSALDGSFSFERIRAGEYLVVSDDYTRTYNAVVADRVMAVP